MRNKRLINFKAISINFAFLVVIFHFSFFIFHLDKAEASALSLSLDPSIIEINAVPPVKTTTLLSVENKSNDQVQLKIELRPFKAKLEKGELEYLDPKDFLIARNIQILDSGVPVERITLGPQQRKNLSLNINIEQDITVSARPPATSSNQLQSNQTGVAGEVGPARQSNAQALAGGRDYYFSIIFISKNSLTPNSNVSLNQLGIATNVLLSIGAKENPDAVLEEFSSGLFYESGPVAFTVRIKNKGKHFIKPRGEILIKNLFGQTIGKLDLPAINVLSDSTRAMPKALWKEDFLLGFYTATLSLSLSDEGPIFSKSINFFALPFQGLILIVIVVISAIITVNRVRNHMKQ